MTPPITPNFLIIGAAKAATTSLSSLLEQHPQVAIVKNKEPHFFSYDHHYQMGWDRYLQLYSHCQNESAVGDASTSYSRIRYHPKVISRIQHHIPHAKIIYMVRHPLQRMESAYIEHLCTPNGGMFSSINDALRRQPMIIDSSRYWEVFDAYRQVFEESRIKVIWFDEYVADTMAVFQEVCHFLEVDDTFVPDLDIQRTNPREEAELRLATIGRSGIRIDTEWQQETRQRILESIQEDSRRFLGHFNRPLSTWADVFE